MVLFIKRYYLYRPSPGNTSAANEKLREAFLEVGCLPQAFSNIEYVGSKCLGDEDNPDFPQLLNVIQSHVNNNSIRSPRSCQVIYKTLKVAFEFVFNHERFRYAMPHAINNFTGISYVR